MVTMVQDVIQALKNLGGQGTLNQIYAEVERIRIIPLTVNWKAHIRGAIEDHSSDSRAFKGTDHFRKLDRGVWALRDQVPKEPPLHPKPIPVESSSSEYISTEPLPIRPSSPEPLAIKPVSTTIPRKPAVQAYLPVESLEEIANILRTINQYREYQSPDSPEWSDYIKDVFHILGFSTQTINPRIVKLYAMDSSDKIRAIASFIRPGENFEEIVPGLSWESHLFLSAHYEEIEWGILTDGLQLKIFDYKRNESKQISHWPDLDGIIREERIEPFFDIYKMFSSIKGKQGKPPAKPGKGGDSREKDEPARPLRRFEFWQQLLAKAKTKTNLHAGRSPGNKHYVNAGAGKTGIYYTYEVRMEDAQIHLYIYHRGEAEWNKRIFNVLFQHKEEIEQAFGDSLDWQLLSDKYACRIRYVLTDYGINSLDYWDELQNQMIDAMVRFEKALRPFIQRLD
ncbi:MAG: DUF4268 domain-containing protein [Chloroflexota bacterium]